MNAERKHDGQVNLRAVLGLGTLPATADAVMLHAANQINAMRQIRDQRERDVAEMRDALKEMVQDSECYCITGTGEPNKGPCGYCKARAIIEKTKGE